MPRGTTKLTVSRREEIVNACEKTMSDNEFQGYHDQRNQHGDHFFKQTYRDLRILFDLNIIKP